MVPAVLKSRYVTMYSLQRKEKLRKNRGREREIKIKFLFDISTLRRKKMYIQKRGLYN
jgi:hypothetical protein